MLKQKRPHAVSSRWILLARQRLGMTQKRLAEALGISSFTINRWEGGHRTPPPYLRLAIEGFLLDRGSGKTDLVALEEISVRFDSLDTRQPEALPDPLVTSDLSDQALDESPSDEDIDELLKEDREADQADQGDRSSEDE